MRLRNHFVVLVAATLLPVLVLAVTVVLLVQRERHASMQRGLQGTARALAAAVDRELDSSVTALETLGDSPALDEGNLPAFYEHARRARDDNPRWLTVFLVEASGRQVMTLLRPLGAPLPDAGDVDYVRAVLDTRRPYVSDLALGVISQRYIITINVPVLRGFDPFDVLAPAWGHADTGETISRLLVAALFWGLVAVAGFLLAVWRLRPAYIRQLTSPRKRRVIKRVLLPRPAPVGHPLAWKEVYVGRRLPLWLAVGLTAAITGCGAALAVWEMQSVRTFSAWDTVPVLASPAIVVLIVLSLWVGVRASGRGIPLWTT